MLRDVTLVCIDTANHALALRALAHCHADLCFARTIFLTDALPADASVPDGVEIVPIRSIESRDDYSRFVLKDLVHHVESSHALVVQWDGFVANGKAWEDAFLGADYIGARWFWFDDGMQVGNGGFSLRSRRLLEALADPRIEPVEAEDLTIGRTYRPLLEREFGIVFADGAMADRFAFEAAYPIGRPFGFHGLFNFCRVLPPAEIAALASAFSPAIAQSQQCTALLRNCLAMNQWAAATALARRILAFDPDRAEAGRALAHAEAAAARGAGVGRNDPCPCGSGKRYKQCHGAVDAARNAGAAAAPVTVLTAPPTRPPAPSADALASQGVTAHRGNDLAGAERAYRAALAVDPDLGLALHYLGVILYQQGDLERALPLLDRAVARVPQEPEFHNNRGIALTAAQRHDEAIAAFRQALALRPEHAATLNNLGLALHANGEPHAARAAYEQAIGLMPQFVQAHWNLGLTLLLLGEYAAGWREYEWRLRAPELQPYLRDYPGARWSGEPIRGRTVLLTAEQGLGDSLQNLRFAQPLAEAGARVIVAIQPGLANLAATVPGVTQVVAVGAALPPYDAHASLMSVPGLLHVAPETVPAPVPYLQVAHGLRVRAQAEVAPRTPGTLAVGLAWSGAPGNAYNRRRAIALASLESVLGLPGVRWFSLQREGEAVAGADAQGAAGLASLALRNDFDGTAALIASLDVVVTVDTSIAHLAGALGKPTFILLPFAADWRWFERRTDSPWYPTARLFRQRSPGDWSVPLAELSSALQSLRRHGA